MLFVRYAAGLRSFAFSSAKRPGLETGDVVAFTSEVSHAAMGIQKFLYDKCFSDEDPCSHAVVTQVSLQSECRDWCLIALSLYQECTCTMCPHKEKPL